MEKKEITRKLKEILSKHEGNTSEGAIYWESEWVGGKQIPTSGGGYRQEGGKLVCKDKEFYQEMADFISKELDKAREEGRREVLEDMKKVWDTDNLGDAPKYGSAGAGMMKGWIIDDIKERLSKLKDNK